MFVKLIRLGKDAELKYLQSGAVVLEMSGVYDIGFGDNKKSQWIKVAMFGQRAEKLVTHFTKGKQIVASMDDVKSEAWISGGEAKSGLSAKLVEFEFAGGKAQQSQPQQSPQQAYQAPAPQPQYQAPPQQAPQNRPAYNQQPQQAPTPQGYGHK